MTVLGLSESDYEVVNQLGDREWRMSNLYKIKHGGKILDFKPNAAQLRLLKESHYRNVILKARQLGMTSWHALMFLDLCLFNDYTNAAIVADSQPVAQEIFIDKVKFAYDNLPEFIRTAVKATRDNIHQMRFSNGSVFRVATTLRGGTVDLLHITEFAKVCKEDPPKAEEIISGALNTVHAGQFICIESTARGKDGHYFDLCRTAQKKHDSGAHLTSLDFKFWFFPWYEEKSYAINSKNVLINSELIEYFKDLESKGIILTAEQKAWYAKTSEVQREYMKREYPSTPEEAFEAANEGFYFAKYLTKANQEKRICFLPYDDNAKTFTSWDIGIGDHCAIWVFQPIGKEIHCIDYYESCDEGLAHYIKWLRSKNYHYDTHFMPHDAASREKTSGKSFVDVARESGLKVQIVKRDKNEMFGIECLRSAFPRIFFDQQKCSKGIKSLENFRKEWNEKRGCYSERSYHDEYSHGAKALIYGIEGIQGSISGTAMSAEEWRRLRREWL